MKPLDQVLEVWGEFACFSRPELKVERFSYPVITPSAARGILDAIYCKPKEFRWQISRVEILNPPNYIALRRNEVKEKISVGDVQKFMSGAKPVEPIWADGDRELTGSDEKGRTQRQTMALRDVRYRLHGFIVPWRGFEDRQEALENQFRRRASKGKCVFQPCFGCREFPAYFRLIDPGAGSAALSSLNMENLGWMLYDVFDLSRPGSEDDPPALSLYQPVVRGGILEVPPYEDERVLKAEGRNG